MMRTKRCLATVILGALWVGVTPGPSAAAAKVTCRSGRTVFRRPGLRVFVLGRVYGKPSQEGSHYKDFYLCGRGARSPRLFDAGSPFTMESVSQYKLVGNRLGFVRSSAGVQSGAEVVVGWVQFGGPVKQGTVWATEDAFNEEEEKGLPKVPAEELDYAIAPDGAVAVIGEGGDPTEWEVALLPVKAHGLGPPKALFKTKSKLEAPEPRSIAITDTSVTWRSTSGQPLSLPRQAT